MYRDSQILVKAYPSTDIGNSYAIEAGSKRIFHAGDLNAWLWIDESSHEEVEKARDEYIRIISGIKEDYPRFDLVMFPVDSRLVKEYWWGAKYFVDNILTSLFVPMHFELVVDEAHKIPRRIDAGAFKFFARPDFGTYVQLAASRSSYVTNS